MAVESAKVGELLSGDKALIAALNQLGSGAAKNRAIRPAMRSALVPINKAAKAAAPVESGALKKSLGIKVKTYKGGEYILGMVGGRIKMGVTYKGRFRDPAKYGYIVEFHSPFLRPALDRNREVALEILAKKVGEGIQKEAAKARAQNAGKG